MCSFKMLPVRTTISIHRLKPQQSQSFSGEASITGYVPQHVSRVTPLFQEESGGSLKTVSNHNINILHNYNNKDKIARETHQYTPRVQPIQRERKGGAGAKIPQCPPPGQVWGQKRQRLWEIKKVQ